MILESLVRAGRSYKMLDRSVCQYPQMSKIGTNWKTKVIGTRS